MSAGEDSEKEDLERIKRAVQALSEFYDTVHIFTSTHKTNDYGTVTHNWGHGSWCARYGQVSEWVVRQEEGIREKARRDYRDEEEE